MSIFGFLSDKNSLKFRGKRKLGWGWGKGGKYFRKNDLVTNGKKNFFITISFFVFFFSSLSLLFTNGNFSYGKYGFHLKFFFLKRRFTNGSNNSSNSSNNNNNNNNREIHSTLPEVFTLSSNKLQIMKIK